MNKPIETAIAVVPLWIDGREQHSATLRCGEVTNPATGEVIRKVPFCDFGEIDAAVAAAAAAFPAWRATPPLRRARILMRFRELLEAHRGDLARLVCEEHGKTLADAAGSVQRGIEVVEFAIGAPHLLKGEHAEDVGRGVDCHSLRQPLGVCCGITPFNFPAMVPLWMFPLAIVCGNTFVLKPSEKVPSTSMRMAKLFSEAGLPDGVLNVVHGDREAVDALLAHPQIRAVSFVGSTPVAKHIHATGSASGKRVQALGGAKNHAVVMADAALEFTCDALTGAAYGSAGERCMAISAVVAVGSCADGMVELLASKAAALKIGAGDASDIDMGPLISRAHRDKVKSYIDGGVEQGAKLVLDGRKLEIGNGERGFFLGPTLFDYVTPEMTIYRDEIFGPVLIVLRVESLDDAIELVNRNPYGNGTAIFTRSGEAARRFHNEIEVGMVGVNVAIPVPMAFFSFGGWKNSLFGDLHVHGMEGVHFYTRSKVVTGRWPKLGAETTGSMAMPTHD